MEYSALDQFLWVLTNIPQGSQTDNDPLSDGQSLNAFLQFHCKLNRAENIKHSEKVQLVEFK